MKEKPQISWRPIVNAFALLIIFALLLILSIIFLHGCTDKIIFRPDVYISGNFSPYQQYYHEPFYPLTIVTIVNGSPYEISIIKDGDKLAGNILPGQHFKLEIRTEYREGKKVSLVAFAHRDKKLAGTTTKDFFLYGNPREQRSETWLIQRWDIRDP